MQTEALRELAAGVSRAEHAERRRLARVLHDQLQQLLVAAKFGATMLVREADAERRAEQGKRLMELLDEAIAESRSLSVELAPPVLYQSGLASALEWLAEQMRQKHGLEVEVAADPSAEPAGEETRALLFQGARELLLNVAKHAGVARASVKLDCNDGATRVVVEDRGRGMPEAPGKGQGLTHLRHRLGLLGGKVIISPARGDRADRASQGLRVELHAPRESRAAAP